MRKLFLVVICLAVLLLHGYVFAGGDVYHTDETFNSPFTFNEPTRALFWIDPNIGSDFYNMTGIQYGVGGVSLSYWLNNDNYDVYLPYDLSQVMVNFDESKFADRIFTVAFAEGESNMLAQATTDTTYTYYIYPTFTVNEVGVPGQKITEDAADLTVLGFSLSTFAKVALRSLKVKVIPSENSALQYLSKIKLYIDQNSNGSIDAGDTLVSTLAGVSGENAFTVARDIYSTTKRFLIGVDTDIETLDREVTFRVEINTDDIEIKSNTTTLAAEKRSGQPAYISSETFTMDGTSSFSVNKVTIQSKTIKESLSDWEILTFSVTSDGNVEFKEITANFVAEDSSIVDHISSIKIYEDTNLNRLVDVGDVLLVANASVGIGNVLSFVSGLDSATKRYLVAIDVDILALGETLLFDLEVDTDSLVVQSAYSSALAEKQSGQPSYLISETFTMDGIPRISMDYTTLFDATYEESPVGETVTLIDFSLESEGTVTFGGAIIDIVGMQGDNYSHFDSIEIFEDTNNDGEVSSGDVSLSSTSTFFNNRARLVFDSALATQEKRYLVQLGLAEEIAGESGYSFYTKIDYDDLTFETSTGAIAVIEDEISLRGRTVTLTNDAVVSKEDDTEEDGTDDEEDDDADDEDEGGNADEDEGGNADEDDAAENNNEDSSEGTTSSNPTLTANSQTDSLSLEAEEEILDEEGNNYGAFGIAAGMLAVTVLGENAVNEEEVEADVW
ncbi:MAG: hypothetical protein GY858_08850 [Candidatus Omnitrophica bacterium]|nr:hypothetical protein [Candidatus Omnitrophota bacterium]